MENSEDATMIEPAMISLKNVQKINKRQAEFIANEALSALEKHTSLSDVCKHISVKLNIKYGQNAKWICMASEDPKMCGYIFDVCQYMQFTIGKIYFLVAAISI